MSVLPCGLTTRTPESQHGSHSKNLDSIAVLARDLKPPERRSQQSKAIGRWKPWEQSTGPRSPEGKAVVSQNAFAGDELVEMRQLIQKLNRILHMQKEWLRSNEVD